MSARFLTALAIAMAFATGTANGADPEKPKPGTAEEVIHALRQPVKFEGGNINDMPLMEILTKLTKQHGIPFVINEDSFKAEMFAGDIREACPKLITTQLKEMSLHKFLLTIFDTIPAAYLVKGGSIEIVAVSRAVDVTGSEKGYGDYEYPRVAPPLVSVVIRGKPLREVLDSIAEDYDLSLVISPKAGKAMDELITARLLNTPADKALDVLAVQCDLRLVRRNKTLLITSAEHARELAKEDAEKERQRIELKRLRLSLSPPKPEVPPFGSGNFGLGNFGSGNFGNGLPSWTFPKGFNLSNPFGNWLPQVPPKPEK
jgi:hypothetical protein